MNNFKFRLTKKNISLIMALGIALYTVLVPTPTPTTETPVQSSVERVERVIDGDTIVLSSGQKVRYIGMNTPERDECFFSEAKAANEKLVLNKEVKLVKDVSETDRYGRLLRYVYIGKTLVNRRLVAEGYASAATYPPDVANKEIFLEAEREARIKERGLWREGVCGL